MSWEHIAWLVVLFPCGLGLAGVLVDFKGWNYGPTIPDGRGALWYGIGFMLTLVPLWGLPVLLWWLFSRMRENKKRPRARRL